MVDFGVQIVEVGLAVDVEQGQKQVSVGGTATDQECGTVFLNGSFHQQPAGYRSNPTVDLKFFAVSFFLKDFQHRGHPSAVARRNTPLEEFYVLYGVRIEYGKESEEV